MPGGTFQRLHLAGLVIVQEGSSSSSSARFAPSSGSNRPPSRTQRQAPPRRVRLLAGASLGPYSRGCSWPTTRARRSVLAAELFQGVQLASGLPAGKLLFRGTNNKESKDTRSCARDRAEEKTGTFDDGEIGPHHSRTTSAGMHARRLHVGPAWRDQPIELRTTVAREMRRARTVG